MLCSTLGSFGDFGQNVYIMIFQIASLLQAVLNTDTNRLVCKPPNLSAQGTLESALSRSSGSSSKPNSSISSLRSCEFLARVEKGASRTEVLNQKVGVEI